MALLSDSEIEGRLEDLEGWERTDDAIQKRYKFSTYLDGIDFVNEVADLAEEANHHPDILIEWRNVTLTLSTHSEGGLTAKDFDLASEIEDTMS